MTELTMRGRWVELELELFRQRLYIGLAPSGFDLTMAAKIMWEWEL